MKTAYEICTRYWPESSLEPHKSGLEKITVLELPADLLEFDKVNKEQTIVIMQKSSVYNSLQVLRRGFSHVLQAERQDLKKELLATCLMILHPETLVEKEIPFFFRGFSEKTDWKNSDRALLLKGQTPKDREHILAELEKFIGSKTELKSNSTLALQILDELYTNALFNAPSQASTGIRANRTATLVESAAHPIYVFAAYDKDHLLLGCSDSHGTLNRDHLTAHLLKAHSTQQAQPNLGSGGAGLGLKMVIENSANFYIYCEKDQRTIIGCGLLLKGRRANLSETKHLHVCFARGS